MTNQTAKQSLFWPRTSGAVSDSTSTHTVTSPSTSPASFFYSRWSPTTYCLILLCFIILLVIAIPDEDFFIVIHGHPITWRILWDMVLVPRIHKTQTWQKREGEMIGSSSFPLTSTSTHFPQGIPGIDHVYIVHFAPQHNRRVLLERTLTHEIGLRENQGYYEFRSEWDRSNILQRLPFIAEHHFSTAKDIMATQRISVAGTLASERVMYSTGPPLPTEPISTSLLIRMANWMQHFVAWEEMIAANHSSLLVLENDAVLVAGFGEKLTWALKQAPESYDLLYIGSCLGRHAPGYSPTLQRINDHIYKAHVHRCASGYVLSRQGAEKLLRGPPMMGMDNIDEWMQFQMEREFTEVYWLEPVLLYEGTKSFLLPVFCSPRTSWFGCDPAWRPISMISFFLMCIFAVFIGGRYATSHKGEWTPIQMSQHLWQQLKGNKGRQAHVN